MLEPFHCVQQKVQTPELARKKPLISGPNLTSEFPHYFIFIEHLHWSIGSLFLESSIFKECAFSYDIPFLRNFHPTPVCL